MKCMYMQDTVNRVLQAGAVTRSCNQGVTRAINDIPTGLCHQSMTGVINPPTSIRKPIDIHFTPHLSGGLIFLSAGI